MQIQYESTEQDTALSVEPAPWRGLSLLDKLVLVLLPILGILFVILPFLEQAFLLQARQAGGLRPLVDWLVNSNGSWIMAGACLGLWIVYLLIRRSRLVNNEHLWVDAGCPQCQERELIRVSRERSDRLYNLLSIPVYRYACRNCTWRGLRIGRRHRPFYADPIAEELALAAVTVGEGEPTPVQAAVLAEAHAAEVTVEAATVAASVGSEDSVGDETSGTTDLETVAEVAGVERTSSDVGEEVNTAATSNHQPAPGEDDDLDWLWQRLNDEQ